MKTGSSAVAHSLRSLATVLMVGFAASLFSLPASGQSFDDELRLLLDQRMSGAGAAAAGQEPGALLDRSRSDGWIVGPDGRMVPSDAQGAETADRDRVAPAYDLLPNALELSFSQRAGTVLRQIGYDALRSRGGTLPVLNYGAIPDDYVLGVGDELVITFRGQVSQSHVARVDREGRVFLPEMPPLPAAGLDFGTFRELLEEQTEASLLRTQVYVSLGTVRALSVMVLGEVRRPGQYAVTSLASLLDALTLADGVRRTGSLRNVQILRGGTVIPVDLYDLLLFGRGDTDLRLREGDRIFVPRLGPVAAVSGRALVPGIYELAPGDRDSSLAELLELAGGTYDATGNRFIHVRSDATGRDVVTERRDLADVMLRQADILLVERSEDVQIGTVELAGHVRVPGSRSLGTHASLRALVRDIHTLAEQPYLLFAVLQTTNPQTHVRELVPVDLDKVLSGQANRNLRSGDRLVVLSHEDIRYLVSADVQAVLAGQALPSARNQPTPALPNGEPVPGQAAAPTAGSSAAGSRTETEQSRAALASLHPFERACQGLTELQRIVRESGTRRFAAALRMLDRQTDSGLIDVRRCPEVFDTHPDVLPLALEHVASLRGEVRRPGAYPVLDLTGLESLVVAAGGVTRDADLANVEVTRFGGDGSGSQQGRRDTLSLSQAAMAQVPVSAGDIVLFNAQETDREEGAITLAGEVARAGRYDIRRGETLGELIARAGGLTDQAYPYGTVFTRRSVALEQRESFNRMARELRSSLAAALAQPGTEGQRAAAAAEAVERLATSLQGIEPTGRMVVEADPTVLQVRPDLDTVLHPGDRIEIPRRPSTVTVSGQVMNPTSLQFTSGARPEEYIEQTGGFGRGADRGRVFVVYPNGQAAPLNLSAWNYQPVQVPPGSAIVVPQDPAPFSLLAFSRDITEVLSQIALTAASIAVISR